MGSPCSHRNQSVLSHWCLRFVSQTSRKWTVFEAHHHWGRQMCCKQSKRSWSIKDEMNRLKPFPKSIFTQKRWCCPFSGILKDFFLSFYRITQRSIKQAEWWNSTERPELINSKGVVFHQAKPHTSLVTHEKLLQLEWYAMPHPTYSPDLATSNYYLFRLLQNFFKR